MKNKRFLGKVASHATALFLGVILTFSTVRVMSSKAYTLAPDSTLNNQPIAPQAESVQAQAPTAINSSSFVAAAVAKTGPAVVRIDTERTIASQAEPLFEDPFFC